MRSKFKWIFTLLVALSMQFSFAQDKTVTGTITDGKLPLPGANVVIKGTAKGVSADMDGKYSIKAKAGDVLVVSFSGYEKKSVTVGSANSYNVAIKGITKQLEDVVILGYDKTSTKAKSSASSTTVSAETFKNRPNVTLLQSLQGSAPGLSVATTSGSPGSAKVDLLIRGLGSINSSTEPLYVIDGIPTNSTVFRNINPEDVESASILRDAIATSVYGNRGSNGVIVIKTKSGKFNSGLKVSYSSSTGFSELPKDKYHLANSQQALEIERLSGYGAGNGDNTFVYGAPGVPLTDSEIAAVSNYDWRKAFFTTGQSTSQNISLSSGGKNVNNFTSISFLDQKGIVPTTAFKRVTLRTNLNGKSDNDKFTFGTNLTYAFSSRNQLDQETNSGVDNNVVQNPLLGALTALPYLSPSMYPGSGQGLYDLIGTNFNLGNTSFVLYDILQDKNIPNRYNEIKFLGNLYGTYKLSNTLSYTSKIGVDYNVSDKNFARAPWSYLAIAVRESNSVPYGGFETQITDRDFGFNSVNSFNYSKKIKDKHTINLGVYSEYIKAQRNYNSLRQNGLDLKNYSFGAGTGWTNVGATYTTLRPTVSQFKAKAGSFSYFSTLSYDYDDKFGFDAVFRRDASYRFVDDNKWASFWSVGGRWNIDKEAFMDNSTFSMLKLRASYGTQGNQNLVGVASGQNPLYSANNLVRDLDGTSTGYGNTGAYALTQLGNTALQWEKQTELDFGLDFESYKGRLSGTIDVYKRDTDNLFLDTNISAIVGWGSSISGNNGSLTNKGIELLLKYKAIKDWNGFNLNVFANASYNKNMITSIPARTVSNGYVYDVGTRVYEYRAVPYVGVNPVNGNLLFLDRNDQLTENPDPVYDARDTGKSGTPSYLGGFGFNADYNGFFFDTQFSFVADVWRYDTGYAWLTNPAYVGDNNVSADLLNAWSSSNPNATVPSLTASNYDLSGDSDMYLKDASYIRLKNVSLGYSFDKKFLSKTFMKSLKLYVQAENMKTWTKWKGFDPDSSNDTSLSHFPSPKTVSVGLNLEF